MTGFRGIDKDPIRNFKFAVSFAGVTGEARAGFSRVSGLKDQTEVVEYREGTDRGSPRKLMGQTTYDNIVCERGLTTNTELRDWRLLITNYNKGKDLAAEGDVSGAGGGGLGALLRREVDIELGDYHAEGAGTTGAAWTWTANAAWPIGLEIGEFTGDGNDVVVETVEFAHEGLTSV
jgi:phage tail-like protein